MEKQAIIIGATSGIGQAVAKRLLDEGWRIAIAGRREERLKALQQQYGTDRVTYRVMDVTDPSAVEILDELLKEVATPEVLLYAAGIGRQNPDLEEGMELRTVKTNCEGMVRIVDHFINYVKRTPYYTQKRKAHIAVITSVAGTKGIGQAPAYSATKSMQSAYLVALSQLRRMQRLPITVGDIRPGFVATEILNPEKHYPMLMTAETAARYIVRSFKRRSRILIFDWRYKLLVGFWRLIPRCIWERMTMVKN
ncbi:MAG: SDR family NAD(P)-dependent oxidoreductase [Alistipes sp.]|nr:SDR family NAD(P)-dependent oxidoreductase [Alistipes sp.]